MIPPDRSDSQATVGCRCPERLSGCIYMNDPGQVVMPGSGAAREGATPQRVLAEGTPESSCFLAW
jgi:hypothetical protein